MSKLLPHQINWHERSVNFAWTIKQTWSHQETQNVTCRPATKFKLTLSTWTELNHVICYAIVVELAEMTTCSLATDRQCVFWPSTRLNLAVFGQFPGVVCGVISAKVSIWMPGKAMRNQSNKWSELLFNWLQKQEEVLWSTAFVLFYNLKDQRPIY